jgi:hypothetical protein
MKNIKYQQFKSVSLGLFILIITLLFARTAYAESSIANSIVVVVNTSDKTLELSKQQIRHIYMGGALSRQFEPINLSVGNPLRVDFNTRVVGLTESRIQAYWAQMKFTGRSKPPIEVSTIDELLEYVQHVDNAIAYLPAGIEIPKNLTVVTK